MVIDVRSTGAAEVAPYWLACQLISKAPLTLKAILEGDGTNLMRQCRYTHSASHWQSWDRLLEWSGCNCTDHHPTSDRLSNGIEHALQYSIWPSSWFHHNGKILGIRLLRAGASQEVRRERRLWCRSHRNPRCNKSERAILEKSTLLHQRTSTFRERDVNWFLGEIVVQVILVLKLQDKAVRETFVEWLPGTILAWVHVLSANCLSLRLSLFIIALVLGKCCTYQLSNSWSRVCQSSDLAMSSSEPWKIQSASQNSTMWCRRGTWTAQYA